MGKDPRKLGEIGPVKPKTVELDLPQDGFALVSGKRIAELTVAYEAYGELDADRANVIFICHALSGDAHVAGSHEGDPKSIGWWDEMVGPGKGIDTDHYHVICANILGGCKGTTGPSSMNPATGEPYGSSFPHITVADIVAVHALLLKQIGIKQVAAVIGASFGGMQVFEMALRYPEMVQRCVCIASAASLSAQALAFDIVGRAAITSDPKWEGGDYYASGRGPTDGLAQARKIGHITYLSTDMMTAKFGREKRGAGSHLAGDGESFLSDFEVERYLDHQGDKFVGRFDANSYLYITQAMDDFDLVDSYGSLDDAFSQLQAKTLVVALTSDWLFPPEQSHEVATALLRKGLPVSYGVLNAPHGHDAFLVEVEHLSEMIRAFLPWVGPHKAPTIRVTDAPGARVLATEYSSILKMVDSGSRVLDLGCGDGTLLSYLKDHKDVSGMGVDIEIHNVIDVIDKGHDVFQADIDGGLSMIPDNMYDYAILSETLQVVHKPRLVMQEMLRVARRGIVSFPNFGKWDHRLYLWATGRMPKGRAIPHEWYDTPNIHPFTVRDFVDLCRADKIQIEDMVCIASNFVDRMLNRCGFCNAGSSRVLVRVTKEGQADGSRVSCTCQRG